MTYATEVIRESIFKTINRYGYILMHDLPPSTTNEIFNLIDEGQVIQLDKISATANFMNASYKVTYADNRFNLAIKDDGYISSIIKTVG